MRSSWVVTFAEVHRRAGERKPIAFQCGHVSVIRPRSTWLSVSYDSRGSVDKPWIRNDASAKPPAVRSPLGLIPDKQPVDRICQERASGALRELIIPRAGQAVDFQLTYLLRRRLAASRRLVLTKANTRRPTPSRSPMAARVMPFSDHPKIVHTSVVAASMHDTYGQSRRTYAQNLPSDMVGIVLRLLLTRSVLCDPRPTRVVAP